MTVTSRGVLFTGDLNNDFLVLDAKTGDVLYRFNTGGSIGGGVISYALDGKQYVAATSGTVSAFFGGSGLPAVVVFAAGSGSAPTTMKPLNPDQAPVATVDALLQFRRPGTTPAPVYVLYREGEDEPVAGQLDIIDTLPGDTGYNDFRQVWKVTVPKDYVANAITDVAALLDAGFKTEKSETLRNVPVVPDKSRARTRLSGESAELKRAW